MPINKVYRKWTLINQQCENHNVFYIIIIIIIRVFCLRAGLSLQTQAPRLQFHPKAGLPPQTQERRLQFYKGWIGAVAFCCSLYSTLSLAYEQTLKDMKRSQGHVCGSKESGFGQLGPLDFTTGVKYQFHQGFWPGQRSRNPNQLLPPYFIYNLKFINNY